MLNGDQGFVESKLTTWENQLIRTKLLGGGSPMTIATEIITAVKKNFGLERKHEEILEAIDIISLDLKKQEKQVVQAAVKIPTLFKRFEGDEANKNIPVVVDVPSTFNKRKPRIHFQSNRKIPVKQQQICRSGWNLQMRLDELQNINQQCSHTIDKYDRKLNKRISTKTTNSIQDNVVYFYHQFFYSNYDKKYFKEGVGLKEIQKTLFEGKQFLTYQKHCKMLKVLPKPALFDYDFVELEKEKLEEFRNMCRQNIKNLTKINEGSEFPVHSVVLALHPMCGHLHTGSILAIYKENQYMVKFMKPELPTQKILDINMSTQFTQSSKVQLQANRTDKSINNQNMYSDIVENVNYDCMAFLIKILKLKSTLIEAMRLVNGLVVENKQSTEKGKKLVQWLFQILAKLQPIVQQTLIRFRLRGINEKNEKPFFKNLTNILINPLKIMSKDLENSSEQIDQNASQQIKTIISHERQNQINKALKTALSNLQDPNLINYAEHQIIRSCMGILADLKHQGKGFDVQSNQNLLKFASLTGEGFTEEFNDLYQKLFSVVSKIQQ